MDQFPQDSIWTVERPGSPALKRLGWVIYAVIIAVMTIGVYLLDSEQRWYIGLIAGIIIGSLVPQSIANGSKVAITPDGTLWYGFGQRRPGLSMPLGAIKICCPIQAGSLQGIGIVCDPKEISLLHRKGLSFAKMRQYQSTFNLPLVLEGLTADDIEPLLDQQERLCGWRAQHRQSI